MGEAEVAAHVMHLEIIASRTSRARGFDSEHGCALFPQPRRRLLRQAGKIGNVAFGAKRPAVEIHVQQHGVLRTDLDARSLLCRLKVSDADVALERLVRQVEANRFGKEVLERDLVDALGAGSLVEMHWRVYVGAGVVAHVQRGYSGRKAVTVSNPLFFVGGEGRVDDWGGVGAR